MGMTRANIERALTPLVGLRLSLVHHAGNMRGFHFGRITETPKGTDGQYAMHVQCPWRIRRGMRIVTGLSDWYFPAEGFEEPDNWDPNDGHSLQEQRLRSLFGCAPEDSMIINRTDGLIVEAIEADFVGGCQIKFSEDLVLDVFPNGSVGEAWRLIQPGRDTAQFVVG
jgi:hypothetical protein